MRRRLRTVLNLRRRLSAVFNWHRRLSVVFNLRRRLNAVFRLREFLASLRVRLLELSLSSLTVKDRISPYNINVISSRKVMRIKTVSIRGLLVDPISNFLN